MLCALGLVLSASCSGGGGGHERERWPGTTTKAPPRRFGSEVQLPHRALGMATPERTIRDEVVRVPCGTCHATLQPRPELTAHPERRRLHKRQVIKHGDLTCRSCHHAPRFEDFRLSNGNVVPYTGVMSLCGQCHSRQLRDYNAGAHGGMRGYWDLNRGPRLRNHCLVCHNPHQPAIPKVLPAPLPRSRFQGS